MDKDPELSDKYMPVEKRDRLSLSVPVDSLWSGYNLPDHRIGWEYRGCYYLLGKKLDAFGPILGRDTFHEGGTDTPAFPRSRIVVGGQRQYIAFLYSIQPEIVDRYREFKQVLGTIRHPSGCVLDVSTIWRYLLVLLLFQDL